jgi:hypothetical protein
MKTHGRRRRYSLKSASRQSRGVRESEKPDLRSCGRHDRLEVEIEEFISSLADPALYQKGSKIGRLDELKVLVESDDRRPLLSFQLGSKHIRRKIIDVRRKGDETLEIQLEHFNQVETIEIRDVADSSPFRFFKTSRKSFQQCVESMIRRNFPKIRILSSVVHSDLEHSLSGRYVRILVMSGRHLWAALAVSPLEDQTTLDGILSNGLIWMEYLRQHHRPGPSRLLLLVPRDRGQVLKSRLKWIKGSGQELFLLEMDVDRESLAYVDLSDSGNVDTLLTRVSTFRSGDDCSRREEFRRLVSLSPQHIEPIYRSHSNSVSFRVRGLEFATLHLRGSEGLTTGVGKQDPVKTYSDWKRVGEMVDEIVGQRQCTSRDKRKAFYRLQAERWLESLILQDIQLIDPGLDSCHVYPQVPAFLGADRGMIDILSITKQGRLAVLELKVSEDIELPVQGLDYWLRVRWHQLHQEFFRKGYFHDVQISAESPVLYFVSPQFRYHDTFPRIVKYFDSSVPLIQVGINEDWRAGIRIVMKRKFN